MFRKYWMLTLFPLQPESEVFEITDFTTASEWERFVSRVEEVLNDWKLIGNNSNKPPEKGEYTSGTWEEKTQDINFADFKFSVTHHCLKQESEEGEGKEEPEEDAFPTAMQDLLCMNNDFPPRAHCLVRWYGMREFVVISPGANCEAVISESKCNLLLSSISISLANTGCQVPMFVQIQQKWRRMYHGECQGLGVRTDFEMVHLRKVPSQYNHLSGLLDIFKSKIGCPLTPLPPINIAIRFTYVLQDWQQYSWPQQPPDFDALLGGEVGGVEFGKLPFGACEDPISELHLATTWPHLTEGIVVDNDVYSDLDPLQAPHWSVRVRKADSPTCLLGDFLTEFFKLCSKKESTEEILGRGPVEEEGKDDISHALSKLTEPTAVPIPKLSVSNMVHSARKRIRRHRRVDESPLSNDVLNSILLYLFPDAAIDKSSSENSESKASQLNTDGKPEEKESDDYNLYNQLKSAPSDSLTYRLALCVCLVNFYHGGVRAVAHLWQEFVLEMRYRWENNYLVYGLASGPPDLRCCLLHQKLQMLNCCIERKRARDDGRKTAEGGKEKERERGRERKVSGTTGTENGRLGPESAEMGREVSPGKSWDSWSDSEDEFFECLSDTEEMKEAGSTDGEKGGAKVAKPDGRLHPHGKLTLLNSQEPLYIPVTQEPAPMTEDLLEEQSEVLAKLGTSAEGAHLRARMQSACLLSDMESFKVLHYLAVQKPADLTRHLLPCILHAAILKEKEEESVEDILSVRKAIQQATSHASKLLRHPSPDYKKLEDVITQLIAVETVIARSRSLKAKFGIGKAEQGDNAEDLERFVSSLLEEPEVSVIGAGRGPAGSIIHKLFVSAQRAALLAPLDEDTGRGGGADDKKPMGGASVPDFPPPAGREILLRTCVPRPAPYSKALPQRLFCVLMREDFRLAGAFSSDTSFF
uniref:Rab3 GTPase-activating protein catalytic subunit n=1 Tax=Oncorhynchus mykiss TaxID=8022 RepID=A0A8C7VFC9_ONCMY